jgi:hypothetical protein
VDRFLFTVYTDSESKSPLRLIIIFCVFRIPATEMQDEALMISRELTPAFGTIIEFRLYELLTPGQIRQVGKQNICWASPQLRIFSMTGTQRSTFLFFDVPLSFDRFILASSSGTSLVPRYLALHKWEDTATFETDEYMAATNTSWRTGWLGGGGVH